MGARLRSWWQQIKTHPVATVLIALVIALVVLVILGGYKLNWNWTGFNGNNKSGKTLWDWLQLLIIPLAIAIIAILFNRAERKNEQRITSDNQQEAALQGYINEMSELLLEKHLRDSQLEDEVRTIARARTLTVLRRLDAERKGSVLSFLHESGLIESGNSIIDLYGANLSGANLSGADLRNADLSNADLSGADLFGANLSGADLNGADLNKSDLRATLMEANLFEANLSGANLSHADLSHANLSGATLSYADLSHANLRGADLSHANLSGATLSEAWLEEADLKDVTGITIEELEKKFRSLKGTIMPDGSIHA